MSRFLGNQTNRLDAKGRVSIPAKFRAVLADERFDGLYCCPSTSGEAIDGGGNGLIREISKRLEGYEPLTPEHDLLSTAWYGISETLKIDRDGRVLLTEKLKEEADITNEVTFVGQGYKFQMWNPQKFEIYCKETRPRKHAELSGSSMSNKSKDAGK